MKFNETTIKLHQNDEILCKIQNLRQYQKLKTKLEYSVYDGYNFFFLL